MNTNELLTISKITNNIYLSGIFPLYMNCDLIDKLQIKYIIACINKNDIEAIHYNIIQKNPNITILYLPYNDNLQQNLWIPNNNLIKFLKYNISMHDYDILMKKINTYKNKPLIEIGYNFMDYVISSNNNILIHCAAGISRSVSLITYYLMKKYMLPYDKAIEIIRIKRNIANPNNSFKLQLLLYQDKRDRFTQIDANNIINNILGINNS